MIPPTRKILCRYFSVPLTSHHIERGANHRLVESRKRRGNIIILGTKHSIWEIYQTFYLLFVCCFFCLFFFSGEGMKLNKIKHDGRKKEMDKKINNHYQPIDLNDTCRSANNYMR